MKVIIVKFAETTDKMTKAEIKLDLFRKIDNLEDPELEKIYHKLLALIDKASRHKLSEAENKAIDEALETSRNEKVHSHEDVIQEAKLKYPNLKFR